MCKIGYSDEDGKNVKNITPYRKEAYWRQMTVNDKEE